MLPRIGLFGAGGHPREVVTYLPEEERNKVDLFVHAEWATGITHPVALFNPTQHSMTIAVGDGHLRDDVDSIELTPRNSIELTPFG